MDKARIQTNKKLNKMEREIGRIYQEDPALKRVQKEYTEYMKMVQERTEASYKAFIGETDENTKEDLKQAYMDEVKALTINSKEYKKLVNKIAAVMAKVNQKALDITNRAMDEVYVINYNQVAEDCKEAGIKVNG